MPNELYNALFDSKVPQQGTDALVAAFAQEGRIRRAAMALAEDEMLNGMWVEEEQEVEEQDIEDDDEKEHEVKLGFMGFFVIAAVQALKKFPVVNASIDGDDIVYHGFQDIGVAVSTERGLVVPVVRNVQNLTIAEIELSIRDLSLKARDGKLDIEDMTGGTFTVSNGGVFGSLLSTPILNPPQSAVLGMHNIVQRPMVVEGNIESRPVMYLALSYDHRIVDGKEAVSFLKNIKDTLEEPKRLFLNL